VSAEASEFLADADTLAALPGLEALRRVADGRLPAPPMATLLGMDLVVVERGRVVFAAVPGVEHYNPIGSVHGGLAATLIDSATGCALHSALEAGRRYTTLDLSVTYLRPITHATGRVLCEGRLGHLGRTVATAEATLVAEATGKLLAQGRATLVLR
jgi:uncharacterized protein (TIGR00369 family)